jgi:hypothetical protein
MEGAITLSWDRITIADVGIGYLHMEAIPRWIKLSRNFCHTFWAFGLLRYGSDIYTILWRLTKGGRVFAFNNSVVARQTGGKKVPGYGTTSYLPCNSRPCVGVRQEKRESRGPFPIRALSCSSEVPAAAVRKSPDGQSISSLSPCRGFLEISLFVAPGCFWPFLLLGRTQLETEPLRADPQGFPNIRKEAHPLLKQEPRGECNCPELFSYIDRGAARSGPYFNTPLRQRT